MHKYHYQTEPYPEDTSDLLLQENDDSCENSESKSAIYESDAESDNDDENF